MHKFMKAIKKLSYFVPFTMYLLVFVAVLIPGYIKLRDLSKLPDSAYTGIFSLLLSIALFFSIAMMCFGFITVLTSFIYFKWKAHKNEINLSLKTTPDKTGKGNNQVVSIQIKPILIPVIGFLKIRVIYDATHISDKFTPVSGKSNFFKFSYDGRFSWNLPEIREYQVEKVIIYFEDFFQFFSIATTFTTSNRFFISPTQQDLNALKASPRKTEETTTRIEELKRVEGELINYKNFETNDDVRRIVWKIYAKNKELVVRIPEIMDPYASHIYLYTCFYSKFNITGNESVEVPFLNYYKTICWSVYKQLSQKGFEVRYVPDQQIPAKSISAPDELVNYAITVSNWQTETQLKDFVKAGNASVIIISSLNDPEQVKEFAESYGSEISMIFVPLSDVFDQGAFKDWIKWLFIESEKTDLSAYRAKWNISPLRFKLKENEKEIRAILKQTAKATII